MGGAGSGRHRDTETAKQIRCRLQAMAPQCVETLEAKAAGKPIDRDQADTCRWVLEHVIGKAPMSVDLSGSLSIEEIRVAVERVSDSPPVGTGGPTQTEQ